MNKDIQFLYQATQHAVFVLDFQDSLPVSPVPDVQGQGLDDPLRKNRKMFGEVFWSDPSMTDFRK